MPMISTSILASSGACAGVAVLAVLSIWSRARALATLRKWAHGERLELLSASRRSFAPLWCSGRGYQFFRVTARGQKGSLLRAWVRCLDFNSAEPHNIEVTWDDKPSA